MIDYVIADGCRFLCFDAASSPLCYVMLPYAAFLRHIFLMPLMFSIFTLMPPYRFRHAAMPLIIFQSYDTLVYARYATDGHVDACRHNGNVNVSIPPYTLRHNTPLIAYALHYAATLPPTKLPV